MTYFLFFAGFIVLILGANWLVEGGSALGRKLRLPSIVIGLTIVAIGTSLPELVINVIASMNGITDLAISNVLGSNILNILIILGITAVIYPLAIPPATSKYDIPFSFAVTLIFGILASDMSIFGGDQNVLGFWDGFLFILLFLAFIVYSLRLGKHLKPEPYPRKFRWVKAIVFIILGLAGLYWGGRWIVDGTVVIAALFEISEGTVGLTIVAFATSLPELVTSIVASVKRKNEIAVGNAIGSCIFNITLVLGVSAMIRPLPFAAASMLDLGMVLAANTFLFVFVFTGQGRKISRVEGALLMILYIFYLIFTFNLR
jgi:cation:H+ antiporter